MGPENISQQGGEGVEVWSSEPATEARGKHNHPSGLTASAVAFGKSSGLSHSSTEAPLCSVPPPSPFFFCIEGRTHTK